MSYTEFVSPIGQQIEPTLEQLANLHEFPGLVVVGSMARAAIRGAHEPTVYEVYKPVIGFQRPRDIDVVAPEGEADPRLEGAVFLDGRHAIDVTSQLMYGAETKCFALPAILRQPILSLEGVPTVTREINGQDVMRTFPIGVQAVLDSVGSTKGKYAATKADFLEFAAQAERRLTGKALKVEFPRDVIQQVSDKLTWKSIYLQ